MAAGLRGVGDETGGAAFAPEGFIGSWVDDAEGGDEEGGTMGREAVESAAEGVAGDRLGFTEAGDVDEEGDTVGREDVERAAEAEVRWDGDETELEAFSD